MIVDVPHWAKIRVFALGGLTRRLKLIGVPLETVFS
jgi:hypothetical protein